MTAIEPGRIARPATKSSQTGWMRWVPALQILHSYDRSWLRRDIVAGLVLTTMLVPVGIAYAQASGLPGINGLYAVYREFTAEWFVRPSAGGIAHSQWGAPSLGDAVRPF